MSVVYTMKHVISVDEDQCHFVYASQKWFLFVSPVQVSECVSHIHTFVVLCAHFVEAQVWQLSDYIMSWAAYELTLKRYGCFIFIIVIEVTSYGTMGCLVDRLQFDFQQCCARCYGPCWHCIEWHAHTCIHKAHCSAFSLRGWSMYNSECLQNPKQRHTLQTSNTGRRNEVIE